jgi:hypothetical protein
MAKALESFLWKEHIYCQTCIFQTAEISAVAMCVWGENVLVLDRRLFVLDVQNEQNTDTPLMILLSCRNHNHSQSSLPLVMSRGPRKRLHKAEKSSGQDVPHYHSFKMLIGKKERHLILSCCFCHANNEK